MRFLIILFGCLFYLHINGQTIHIKDKTGKPLPLTYIVYKELSSKESFTMLTDSKGNANLSLKNNKKVLLKISHIGYETITDTLIQKEKIYELNEIYIPLDETVVTAQYAPGSTEKSVHKMKVISRKEIDARGSVNLRDVLANENNIRISQDNVLGSSLSMQGISGQNVKILLDGVPLIGRLNGNLDLSQINLNNIERIEIIEGPLSVNYGTDALAGTINLISQNNQNEKDSSHDATR